MSVLGIIIIVAIVIVFCSQLMTKRDNFGKSFPKPEGKKSSDEELMNEYERIKLKHEMARLHREKADLALRNDDIETAIKEYAEVLKVDPMNVSAKFGVASIKQYQSALVNMSKGDFETAEMEFSRILEITPDWPQAKYGLESAVTSQKVVKALQSKNFDLAITECKAFLEKYPKTLGILASLAVAYTMKDEYDEAEKCFHIMLESSKGDHIMVNTILEQYGQFFKMKYRNDPDQYNKAINDLLYKKAQYLIK
jgi:tetratricopeptide (TPR) repeat protein